MVDRSGRLPGRGAYVCFDAVCLRKALKPTKLASAFKRPIAAPAFETLRQAAIALLYERLRACLSMAQKAGAVISGYTPLHKAFVRANIVCMVLATDIVASRAEEYRSWCVQRGIPCPTLFTKDSLGSLIGKANRSAVGLTEPRFRERLCATMASLEKLGSCDTSAEAKSGLPLASS
jgi:ribosomal protein L7Ae-like RNA K-turn-binding protein